MFCKNYHLKLLLLCGLVINSCNKNQQVNTAFYYWKTSFSLNTQQKNLLQQTGNNLYLRFFDIKWNKQANKAYPEAVVHYNNDTQQINITPVIFITNEVFSKLSAAGTDSLAFNSLTLLNSLKLKHQISFKQIQIDCDWSLTTRDNYFAYLKKLKILSGLNLEATIRLHQVKYKKNTGIPPVQKGILMFYNMGKLQAYNNGSSSIFSPDDAEKYLPYLSSYPLPLDVALPLFSWIVHSRDGRVIKLYQNLSRDTLLNRDEFNVVSGVYRARKSFFLNGIYIKQNDNFKPEVTDLKTLKKAAEQLSASLPKQFKKTVIYYELANINPAEFTAKDILKVSAHF